MITLYELASRFLGEIKELPGAAQHPFIQWCHMLCRLGPDQPDEVAWCSSGLNGFCYLHDTIFRSGVPRSYSAAARSWLKIGHPTLLHRATRGWDIVVLKRGNNPNQGHVGLFSDWVGDSAVTLLGCNQSDSITLETFQADRIVEIRTIQPPAFGVSL